MAVPAYTTDLTLMADYDTVEGTIAEPTVTYTAGRSPDVDSDYPIEGTVHVSETFNTVGLGGILTSITAFTLPTGEYIFGWLIWTAPSTIATQANGGLCMLVGDGLGTFYSFYVGGSDFGTYPYGGWQNFVVDPTGTAKAADATIGTAPTSFEFFGIGCDCITKVSKGNPMANDVFRYGRGEVLINGGQSGSLATFAGLAAVNDPPRWGLFAVAQGGYQWKGLMSFGPTSLTEFTDSNIYIVIENTEYVAADFNRLEFNNTSSVINWTNVSITALGTVAKGELEMIDDCTFNDTTGTFTGMSTFIYQSGYNAVGRTWRSCGQVTQGGATLTSCIFDAPAGTVGLLVDNLDIVTKCSFISDGTGYAVDLGTYAADDTITWDNTDTGYGATDTTNATITANVPTGVTLTINVSATGSTPTYNNTAGSPGTISVVAGQKSFAFTLNPAITGYEWRLYDVNATGSLTGAVELDGEETATLSTQSYSYTYVSDDAVAVQIIDDNYVESVTFYTFGNLDQSVTVNLTVEENT
jgi:hypothetical protein